MKRTCIPAPLILASQSLGRPWQQPRCRPLTPFLSRPSKSHTLDLKSRQSIPVSANRFPPAPTTSRCLFSVAVGTALTGRPPHRFGHPHKIHGFPAPNLDQKTSTPSFFNSSISSAGIWMDFKRSSVPSPILGGWKRKPKS